MHSKRQTLFLSLESRGKDDKSYFPLPLRDVSRAAATSKMEHFVIIVNGLDVAAALDPPLMSKVFFFIEGLEKSFK